MPAAAIERRSVDLSAYPDLVVIELGFKVKRLAGIRTLFGIGKGLRTIKASPPEGLLAEENLFYSLSHVGFRQYWRDFEALEAFTKSEPHAEWWRNMRKYLKGAGFWHETYRMRGGMEAIYIDMPMPVGFGHFAAERRPTGPFMSARERLAA